MIAVVLDTNVFISGIFWSGPPYLILDAWRKHQIELIYSLEIFEEYIRVSELLAKKYKGIEISPFIELIPIYGKLYTPVVLKEQISNDSDDDKFIACALAANCKIIISGDQDLLKISEYKEVFMLKPSTFVQKYLKKV